MMCETNTNNSAVFVSVIMSETNTSNSAIKLSF